MRLRNMHYAGKVDGNFTFLGNPDISDPRNVRILVRCICGKEVNLRFFSVINKSVKSCGCLDEKWTGKILHGYTVLSEPILSRDGRKEISVRCDGCQKEEIVDLNRFKANVHKHCACRKTPRKESLIGKKYGNFTVLEEPYYQVSQKGSQTYYAKVRCICGKEYTTSLSTIQNGRRNSCGCIRKDPVLDSPDKGKIVTGTTIGQLRIGNSTTVERNGRYVRYFEVFTENGEKELRSHSELAEYQNHIWHLERRFRKM